MVDTFLALVGRSELEYSDIEDLHKKLFPDRHLGSHPKKALHSPFFKYHPSSEAVYSFLDDYPNYEELAVEFSGNVETYSVALQGLRDQLRNMQPASGELNLKGLRAFADEFKESDYLSVIKGSGVLKRLRLGLSSDDVELMLGVSDQLSQLSKRPFWSAVMDGASVLTPWRVLRELASVQAAVDKLDGLRQESAQQLNEFEVRYREYSDLTSLMLSDERVRYECVVDSFAYYLGLEECEVLRAFESFMWILVQRSLGHYAEDVGFAWARVQLFSMVSQSMERELVNVEAVIMDVASVLQEERIESLSSDWLKQMDQTLEVLCNYYENCIAWSKDLYLPNLKVSPALKYDSQEYLKALLRDVMSGENIDAPVLFFLNDVDGDFNELFDNLKASEFRMEHMQSLARKSALKLEVSQLLSQV
ncbi:hypothetical protein AB4254_09365 [Vibrio breoganii]